MHRVCRQWRRMATDNSLWRHIDLKPYKLDLGQMWKVFKARLSHILLTLRLRGFMDKDSIQVKKQNVSLAMLKELKERCPNITELELIKMNLPHISGDDLPRSLQCLKITHSFLAPGWLIGNTKSNVLPNIRYLDLTGSTKTCDSDLKEISTLSSLTTLILNGCYRVTKTGLSHIVCELHQLKSLELQETTCNDAVIHNMCRNLKHLLTLNLRNCSCITGSTMAILESSIDMKTLTTLDVRGCAISSNIITRLKESFPKADVLSDD